MKVSTLTITLMCCLFHFNGQAQEEPNPSKNPKGFMQALYEPVDFDLPEDPFNKQKERFDMKSFESSKHKSISVLAVASKEISDMAYLQEEGDDFIKQTFEYGSLVHVSGKKVKFLVAIKKNAKDKVVHFIFKNESVLFSIIYKAKIEIFDKYLDLIEQSVKKVKLL